MTTKGAVRSDRGIRVLLPSLLAHGVAALGAAILLGWIITAPSLPLFFVGSVTMKANTAAAMALCGCALALLARARVGWHRLAMVLAGLVLAVAAATLGEYFFGWKLGIDEWIVSDYLGSTFTAAPGRMAPTTAFCLAFAAIGLIAIALSVRWRFLDPIAESHAVAILTLGTLTLIGFVVDAAIGRPLLNHNGVALVTAGGFIALGLGMFLLIRSRGAGQWTVDGVTTGLFICGIISAFAIATFSNQVAFRLQKTSAQTAQAEKMGEQLGTVRSRLISLESTQRGYLLTGEERLLETYDRDKSALRGELEDLERLTVGQAGPARLAALLRPLVAQRERSYGATIERRRRRDIQAAAGLVATGEGIRLSREIDQLLTNWQSLQMTLLADRKKEAAKIVTEVELFLPLGMGMTLMLLLLALFCYNATTREQKEVRAALAESEHRLHMAVQAANIGLWEWDLASHELYSSPAWTTLIGYQAGEISNSFAEWRGRIHPDDVGPVFAKIKAFLDQPKGKYENEYRLRHKDGSYRWIYTVGDVLRAENSQPGKMVGCHIDITDRKVSEQRIEESESQFRGLVEHAAFGIVLASQDGWYSHANASFLEMTGYTLEEFLHLHVRDLVPPNEAARVDPEVAQVTSGAPYTKEWWIRRKDGTLFPAEVSGRVLPDGRLVGFVRDLTERKQTEERLRQSQKMEAIGQFAGGIAHDFNNLLMIISSYGELVKSFLQGEKEKHYADEMLAASSRGAALVRQLMAFSHNQVETRCAVEVNGVLQGIGEMLTRLVGKGIDLQVIPAGSPCPVNIDRGQLEQILLNLSANARDAMPRGGILTLEVIPLTLREDALEHGVTIPAGAYVLIAVSDSGTGIPPEIRGRIFEPFFTTKPAGKGTGLGLATVQDIVKKHGGRISVVSEPGLGSSFKIYLPQREMEATGPSSEADVPGGVERVLLVEDEAALRVAIGQYLRSKGYAVTEVNSGFEAVNLSPGKFDVLVTDVMMPGMTGMELAKTMHLTQPELPVLFMSGYTDGVLHRTKRIEPGAVFLQKPFVLGALATKLRDVLRPPRIGSTPSNEGTHV